MNPRAGLHPVVDRSRALPRLRLGRLEIYAEPRDVWVGAYVAPDALYLCLAPFTVLRWTRGRAHVPAPKHSHGWWSAAADDLPSSD